MTRTFVPIALGLCLLAPSPAFAQADLVLVLAEDAQAWRDSLVERYGMSVEIGPPPRGATQFDRDVDARALAQARGATHALWREGAQLRVASQIAEARSMDLLPGDDALARTALLLVSEREPPRLAGVSDYDRDRIDPRQHFEPRPCADPQPRVEPPPPATPSEEHDGIYGGVYAIALFVAGGPEQSWGGGGVRGTIGYQFWPYFSVGAYVDAVIMDGEDAVAPLDRACGELAVAYPWNRLGFQFSGHLCGGYASVLDSNTGAGGMWTAGAAISLSAELTQNVRLWGRAELDAMMGTGIEEAWLVPALVAGATFE